MRRGVMLGALVLVGVVVLAGMLIVQTAAQSPSAPESSPTAEAVLRQVVEDAGEVYAGPCVETRSPEDTGKVCASFVAEQDEQRAYLTGRTFSEYSQWVFLAREGEGWRLVGTAPLDFHSDSEEIPWPG
jgi:hypothetical protein